jgi:hypothetical protein
MKAAKRTVRASERESQYRVRGDKTAYDAVHKPEALHEREEK